MKTEASKVIYRLMLGLSTLLWIAGLILSTIAFGKLFFIFGNGQNPMFQCMVAGLIFTAIISVIFHNVPSEYVKPVGNGGWQVTSFRHAIYPAAIFILVMILTSR